MSRPMTNHHKLVLTRGLEHVNSVPYAVSLRWLFYRLYQEGIYTDKAKYRDLKDITSAARHNGWLGWCPDTLADDTRGIYFRGIGAFSEKDAIDAVTCKLDKFQDQDTILMILFEAGAMYSQFNHYTNHIPLVPFKGDPSIHLKYSVSMAVKQLHDRYEKPVRLLYFGDFDKKGLKIFDTANRHITKWCPSSFTFTRCGLTYEQVQQFEMTENPGHPGSYQWEALTDPQAAEIITSYVSQYQDMEVITPIITKEKAMLERWKNTLQNVISEEDDNDY